MYNSDIWHIVFSYLNLKYQIRLRNTCKKFYKDLQIIDLYNIDEKYIKRITNDIIQQHKHLKLLNIENNDNVTNLGLNGLSLHTLNISYFGSKFDLNRSYSSYREDCLTCMMNGKSNITDIGIKNMTSIHTLKASGVGCLITDIGIINLKELKILDISYNRYITDKGIHDKKLTYLNIETSSYSYSEITDKGIEGMPLIFLNASNNLNITDAGIKDMQIQQLYISDNPNITNEGIINMPLTHLDVSGIRSNISKKGIATKLKYIKAKNNPNIKL
jgi:hypothetical protein